MTEKFAAYLILAGTHNSIDYSKDYYYPSPVVSPYCGLRTLENVQPFVSNRVVGGVPAQNHEFPWQVSVRIKGRFGFKTYSCGGCVLNDYFVLTAAHCVDAHVRNVHVFILTMGTNQWNDGEHYDVTQVIVHEQWNTTISVNDIALLRTNKPIRYTYDKHSKQYTINSICLPPPNEKPFGPAVLAGWGQIGEKLPSTYNLMKVELRMFPHHNCVMNYRKEASVNEKQVCYGGRGTRDSCKGDSGGPLIQTRNGRAVIIGIVSFGIPCAISGFPGVYTLISKYIDWINKHAKA